MNRFSKIIACAGCVLTLLAGVSCAPFGQQQQQQQQMQTPPPPPKPVYLPGSYEHFVKQNGYPTTMHIFQDKELLKVANKKCPIYIDLEHQRGRLYVEGKVAADWPVSTGVSSHPTRTGKFSVIEKKATYASNSYGKIYDANGKCVNYNADFAKDPVPEGGKIVGSPMPFWQRLTHDGIGMHIGKVRAGKKLSHGCIRTPAVIAKELFRITHYGTKVYINDSWEACYPVSATECMAEIKAELEAKNAEAAAGGEATAAPAAAPEGTDVTKTEAGTTIQTENQD